MAVDPDKLIAWYKNELALGNIDTLEPLLSLFTLNDKPLSLIKREPMLPIFKTTRPKRMTLQAGRQVSKTMSLGELSILLSGLSRYTSVIVEPRFVQKKAINVQVLTPLLRDCVVQDRLIKKGDIETLDVKKFLSGGQLHLINGFKSADSARGVSGVDVLIADECHPRDETLSVYDFTLKKRKMKKICDIVAGDVLTSFSKDVILYSVVTRDASYRGIRSVFKIRTKSGRSVSCTESHTLPTNKGKLRLCEVAEYARANKQIAGYVFVGNSETGKLQYTAAQCDNGFFDGRRLFYSQFTYNEGYQVEPQLEAARVQSAQIRSTGRPCYKSSDAEEKSRIRGAVVSTVCESCTNPPPYLRVDAPKWYENQNHNARISSGNKSPDCACLVVHGRRLTSDTEKRRGHSYEWVFERGGSTATGVADVLLESERAHNNKQAQQHKANWILSVYTCKDVCSSVYFNRAICTGVYEIQNNSCDVFMCSVRNAYNQGSSQVLFAGVCEGVQNATEKSLGRLTSRADQRASSGMETSECREGQRGGCSLLCGPHTGAESAESGICSPIQRKEPREDIGSTQRASQHHQKYSGVQSSEAGLGQSIPGEVETRSRACSEEECKDTRERKSSSSESGNPREDIREAESLQSSDIRGPGEACTLLGEKQNVKAAQRGCLDDRENRAREAEGSRAFEGLSREDQGGSGEVCCKTGKGQRVSPQRIYEQDAGGKGSYQCAEKGASCGESTLSRKNHKSSREIRCKDVGEVVFDSTPKVVRARTLDTLHKDEESFAEKLATLTPQELSNISLVVCKTTPVPSESRQPAKYFYDPIVSIEYVGEAPVYDIEVLGTHNYILANGICSYNCQDLLNENLPVFEAVADAKVDTGFRIYSGTAKTIDGTLAIKFEQSSQGHWCVKCSCGKYVIFAPEEQLFSTITDKGCCCPFCGKKLNTAEGGFVHKFPSRQHTHVGYHLPQTIFPFHHTEAAWTEILYKKNNIPKTQFYNEVLGISDSDSVRLLTKQDLVAARNNIKSKEDALKLRPQFQFCVLGVDWGGGGNKESATGVAVLAKNMLVDHFETLFMARLPQGLSPEQEAAFVDHLASEFHVDLIAHDFTGAGWMREAFFLHAFPSWRERVFPVTYSYKPTSELVTTTSNGSRVSYVIDKTKSLLMTINCIKHGALTVPWFDPLNAQAPQMDFLAIIEHEQKTGESSAGGQILKSSSVYLLEKAAGVKDDAAQAVNIGFIALCHTLGYYPVLSYDSKYDITEEQYRMLDGDESY